MSHDISGLKLDCPHWQIWASDAGQLYATRPGLSTQIPGASVTVTARTPAGLRQAITTAEQDHARTARPGAGAR